METINDMFLAWERRQKELDAHDEEAQDFDELMKRTEEYGGES